MVVFLTVRTCRQLLSQGLLSTKELCTFCWNLAVAGEEIWGLNAFAHQVPLDDLLSRAEQADERRSNGQILLSPLDGIPFSIKANLAVEGEPLTAGSRILGATIPTTPAIGYNADVVQSLVNCGAMFVGVTTMDEFGMGSLGTHHADQRPTKNVLPLLHKLWHQNKDNTLFPATSLHPHRNQSSLIDLAKTIKDCPAERLREIHEHVVEEEEANSSIVGDAYSAGGSTCGGAVSVAHGSSLISLGSDTGGSIRLPAGWCSLVGLKPSYGRLSRHGLVSYASSLDTVGILGRSSHCVALTLQQLLHHQQNHSSSALRDSTLFLSSSDEGRGDLASCRLLQEQQGAGGGQSPELNHDFLSNVTIGIPEAFSVNECPPLIRDCWMRAAERLESRGAQVHLVKRQQLSPDVLQHSLAAYYVLVTAEASSNLARYDGFRYGVGYEDLDHKDDDDEENKVQTGGTAVRADNKTGFTLLEHQFAKARTVGFGLEVIRRILCGTAVLSSDRFHCYYESAARLRALLTQQLRSCLIDGNNASTQHDQSQQPQAQCDMLLVPTSLSFPPPKLGRTMEPVEIYANDVMTVPASLAGLPAVSVPLRGLVASSMHSSFLPAMQLIGSRMHENRLLEVASVLESPPLQ